MKQWEVAFCPHSIIAHQSLTCPCPSPSWRAHQTAASSARRWCRRGVWAAPGSSASGCCTPGPSRHASCSCWGPRRWRLCPGWRSAARGDCAGPSACWSERWRAERCGGPRPGRNPWRSGHRSCGWRTRRGRSLHRERLRWGDPSWWPGRRFDSASWEADLRQATKKKGIRHVNRWKNITARILLTVEAPAAEFLCLLCKRIGQKFGKLLSFQESKRLLKFGSIPKNMQRRQKCKPSRSVK